MNFTHPFGPEAGAIVLIALCMIGLTDFRSSVMLYAVQSILLGFTAVSLGRLHAEPVLVIVGSAVVVLKGLAVPYYLIYAAKKIGCRRDVGMTIAPPLQFFMALIALSLLVLLRPLREEIPLTALPALGILMLGMLLMMTRRLAVSQIVGFLVLENGIFLYTIAQPHSMPLIVEIGVMMDVLAGTMLAGLLAFRINKTFEHIDVTELKELRG
jgi:hydrogenase-4 component E